MDNRTRALMMSAGGAAEKTYTYIEDVFSTFLYTGNGSTQTITNGIGLGPTFVIGKTYRKAFNKSDNGTNFTFTAQPGDVLVIHLTAGTLVNGNASIITINGQQESSASIFDSSLNYFYRTAIKPVSGTVTYSVSTDAPYMDVVVFTVSPAVNGTSPSVSVQSNYALTNLDNYALSSFSSNGYGIAINVSRETFQTYVDPGFTVFSENTQGLWATTVNAILGNGTTVPNATIKGLGTTYNDPVIVLNVANSGTSPVDDPGEGGMVWNKSRSLSGGSGWHFLYDTARGVDSLIASNSTISYTITSNRPVSSFNSDGFTTNYNSSWFSNNSGSTYASWTFRKAPGFFDVVTYTGNGTLLTLNHNLGSVPGCIIVKRTDTISNWPVYHRSLSTDATVYLNTTTSAVTRAEEFGAVTSTTFQVGDSGGASSQTNASGGTYVAYLFAHDAGGFGDSGNESVIKCGSFTYTAGTTVDLGWEPQWILLKSSSGIGDWFVIDTQREWTADGNAKWLIANLSDAESGSSAAGSAPTSTGFRIPSGYGTGATYIYIAIRRGPMKTPTAGTDVFDIELFTEIIANGTNLPTGFPVDLIGQSRYSNNPTGLYLTPRLTKGYLPTFGTNTEAQNDLYWDRNDGIGINSFFNNTSGTLDLNYLLRRAPGFFDVVAYTGTGTYGSISHNLGVAPELIISKSRSGTSDWEVVYAPGNNSYAKLNSSAAANGSTWGSLGTSTTFRKFLDISSTTYIAYLFATCPGVSKVGIYTGTGTTLDIDCGFTNGARFVLIKRTDSTGDWYVWDTARGIVSGNDPYFFINSSAGQDTSKDYIDPLSSGFQISSTAPAAINANGGSFIFLAIA